MRVLMFLRPTNLHGTKGAYTTFRKTLVSHGFVLLQPEVFLAAVRTRRAAEHLVAQMREMVPPTGSVCALVLTERQYASMTYLTGGPSYQEIAVGQQGNVSL
jgi:CRISPR-associated protein Cas2